ncbi:MAG: alpha/beta hydrolase [Alphaproteobacteria bacterium]
MIPIRPGFGIPLVLAAGLVLAACAPGRGLEAMRVLADIDAGFAPSRLKETTPAPTRTAVVWSSGGAPRRADLYRPGETASGRLVLVPGVAETGKDDPRLVALATTLARARFAVLVPDLGELRALRVHGRDGREIADAVLRLGALDVTPPDAPLGVVAVSYAVGPAVLAALEPDTRDRIDFVVGIGGYYDIEAVVTFFTTGAYRLVPGGVWQRRKPNAYGKWVFVLSNLDRVADARDRVALEAIARRRLAELDADVSDLVAGLGPEGRAFQAVIENADPERTPALIAALPAPVRAEIAALDLAGRDLTRLEARLLLVHGREDDIIPFSESRALARAAGPGRADLFLVDGFSHVDPDPVATDRFQLWRAIYRLLELRDRKAGG